MAFVHPDLLNPTVQRNRSAANIMQETGTGFSQALVICHVITWVTMIWIGPDSHGSGSQVSTSLSTSIAPPSTRRCINVSSETISDDIRFRKAKQSQLNPSM